MRNPISFESKHIDRFWQRVQAGPMDACWEWTGATNTHRYGTLRVGRTNIGAHRASWLIHHGPIPFGMQVLHHCDNRPCCNPSHLFLGTHQDNMNDRNSKGRQASGQRILQSRSPDHACGDRNGSCTHPDRVARGERQWQAKLTASQVLEIRARHARGERQTDIAVDYGVRATTINWVVLRKTWTHI